MRAIRIPLIILILIFLLFAGTVLYMQFVTEREEAYTPMAGVWGEKPANTILTNQYYSEPLFQKNNTAQPYELDGTVLAVVVPHYEPALHYSASVLSALDSDYETIVVVGPNHAGTGSSVIISDDSWSTPLGTLTGDSELADALRRSPDVSSGQDREILDTEWSNAVHMPYLKHYFPDAKVVSVLLSRSAGTAALASLGNVLADIAENQKILVLCSVDFSHYQTPEEALARDTVTKERMLGGSPEALRRLRGENLDSPETITLLNYLRGERELHILENPLLTYTENGKSQGATYFICAVYAE